jgi:hypothetical protein
MIDFDGVIHDYKFGWNNGIINDMIPGADIAIQKLKNMGFEIVIFTTRVSPSFNQNYEEEEMKVAEFLDSKNIPFDNITAEKLPAVAYIDDHAIEFKKDWTSTLEQIKNII